MLKLVAGDDTADAAAEKATEGLGQSSSKEKNSGCSRRSGRERDGLCQAPRVAQAPIVSPRRRGSGDGPGQCSRL